MGLATILQDEGGDWQLENGTLVVTDDAVHVAGIKLRNRFRLWRGSWYGDLRVGIPYREVVFRKGTPLDVIRRLFLDVILSLRPTIASVEELRLSFDPRARDLVIFFRATSDAGQPLERNLTVPFIVGPTELE